MLGKDLTSALPATAPVKAPVGPSLVLDRALTPVISQEPAPIVSPPAFRPPETISAPIVFPREMPEPYSTTSGLVLMNFKEASAFCSTQEKRLPRAMEVAQWAAQHGAQVASVQKASLGMRSNPDNAVYTKHSGKTNTVDFYFNNARFVYPAQKPITNAAVWTSEARVLGTRSKATRYAFSLYSASFSPVPDTSMLAVVCVNMHPGS